MNSIRFAACWLALLLVPALLGAQTSPSPAQPVRGALVLKTGNSLPCSSPGMVVETLVACQGPDGAIAHAPLDHLDRSRTEASLGPLTWYVLDGGKPRQIAAPDPARKQPDPRVLASLRAIQERREIEDEGRDARELLASEQEVRAREQAEKQERAEQLIGILRPLLVAARCRATHPKNGVAQELCRMNG